jgi:hypothetical protein
MVAAMCLRANSAKHRRCYRALSARHSCLFDGCLIAPGTALHLAECGDGHPRPPKSARRCGRRGAEQIMSALTDPYRSLRYARGMLRFQIMTAGAWHFRWWTAPIFSQCLKSMVVAFASILQRREDLRQWKMRKEVRPSALALRTSMATRSRPTGATSTRSRSGAGTGSGSAIDNLLPSLWSGATTHRIGRGQS